MPMTSIQQVAEVLRLFHRDKWKVETIAKHLGIHHSTVKRVLKHNGLPERRQFRSSIIDEYAPFIISTLEAYPRLTAARLYDMCVERGYQGGPDHFRTKIRELRPKPRAEAFLRLSTSPGEQAQVDWGHFGKIQVGNALRALMAFVMVLSWSRQIFLRFFLGASTECFLRGHVEAFRDWSGVPRSCLYDNLKSAVINRQGDVVQFNDQLLMLAAHYRFEPRVASPYRGNEKGRVERAIRYVRDRFFAGRYYRDLADLNAKAQKWSHSVAAERFWPDEKTRRVSEVFEEEKTSLITLPEDRFVVEERREVQAGKTPYIRFDLNDYSIPPSYVRRTLSVWADETRLRVMNEGEVIACHQRSYSRGEQIEDPTHLAELVEAKAEARRHRGMNRLFKAAPSTAKILEVQKSQGNNIGSVTARLLELLEQYDGGSLEEAVQEALDQEVTHYQAVAQILDRNHRAKRSRGRLPIRIDREDLKDLEVKPHSLADYDDLACSSSKDEEGGDHVNTN